MATSRNVLGQKVSTGKARARPEHDFYATPEKDIERMLRYVFSVTENANDQCLHVLDPCAGNGAFKRAINNVMPKWTVTQWDIIQRREELDWVGDFLQVDPTNMQTSIIVMNPPFGLSVEFIQHALKFLKPGGVLIAFLKLDFLASKKRYNSLFKDNNQLAQVIVNVSRVNCKYDGDGNDKASSTTDSGWFIFQNGMPTTPVIRWME